MTQSKATKGPESSSSPFGEVPSHMQQFAAQWAASAQEQLVRLEQTTAQLAAWQKEGVARAQEAAEEATRLAKSSIEYGTKLAEQWQAAAMDAARKTIEMVTPRA